MYDKFILLSILLKEECRTIDNNSKAYPPSTQVYNLITKNDCTRMSMTLTLMSMTIDITTKHVIVNKSRNGFRQLLQQHFGVTCDNNAKKRNNSSSFENSSVKNISVSSDKKNL